jgi:hypothetical protein
MFTPAQLLCNWHEQRPSNQRDVDSSVEGRLGESTKWGGPACGLFLYLSTRLLLGCIIYSLYKRINEFGQLTL